MAAMRVGLLPFVVVVAIAAAASGIVGMRMGARTPASIVTGTGASAITLALPPMGPADSPHAGAIGGINVNLRAGPGLGYPIVARLQANEPVTVLDERTGWYSVTTSTGVAGWVFAAYVSGIGIPDRGPAIVRRMVVGEGAQGQVILRPGDRVLHLRVPDGDIALMPDGQRIRVEEGTLADAR
jgi:hypothetical protein